MDYNLNPKDYYPRMHSAEHLLNGTMNQMFLKGRAFSAHIEKKKSKCDYHFDRNLSSEEIQKIEERINSIISDNLKVTEEFLQRETAETEFNLNRLPDEAGDVIRIIKIGEYDVCPCSGTHVVSTKEIGGFKIISTSFENNILRIRFKLVDL